MSKRVAYFFAPVPAIQARTRLAKMARVLLMKGYTIKFFGWERIRGEFEEKRWGGEGVSEHIVLRGGGYATRRARLLYILWMFVVFLRMLRVPRSTICFCLGWETAFPGRLAALISGARIVFDDADRFSLLIKVPRPLKTLLVALEKWTSNACELHIVPGWSRYEWQHDRMVLLRNSPMTEDYEFAQSAQVVKPPGDLVLYVNGWIAWDTGAPVLLDALKVLDEERIEYTTVLAGRVVSDAGEKLLKHHRTMYYGHLPQREALALYKVADVVLTMYDPAVEINRHAESNKWGDCVYFETPFIVNSEVETAKSFVDAGAAFAVPYNDARGLGRLLSALSRDKEMLRCSSEALKQFAGDYAPYDSQFESIVRRLETGRYLSSSY